MQTAKSRSISRAAKEMHISQPAVSLAIGKLEDALGVKLFFRSNRGISLTNEGSILLERLSSAFSLIEAGEEKTARHRGTAERNPAHRRERHDSAVLPARLSRAVPRSLSRRQTLPSRSAPTPSTLEALRGGLIDFGVVSEPVDTSDEAIEFIPVREAIPGHLRAVGKIHGRGKEARPGAAQKIPAHTAREEELSTRRYIDSFFGEGTLSPSIELATSDLLIEFAETRDRDHLRCRGLCEG